MPVSGSPEELLHAAGIDAEAIASAARRSSAPAPELSVHAVVELHGLARQLFGGVDRAQERPTGHFARLEDLLRW